MKTAQYAVSVRLFGRYYLTLNSITFSLKTQDVFHRNFREGKKFSKVGIRQKEKRPAEGHTEAVKRKKGKCILRNETDRFRITVQPEIGAPIWGIAAGLVHWPRPLLGPVGATRENRFRICLEKTENSGSFAALYRDLSTKPPQTFQNKKFSSGK